MERPRSGASAVLITDHPEPGKYDCKRTVLLPYPTCRLNLLWRIGFSLFHNAHAVSSEEALLFKKTISRNQMSWAHFVLTRSFHLRNICIQLLTRVMPSSWDDCWSAVFDFRARTLLSAMRHIKHRRQLAAQCRIYKRAIAVRGRISFRPVTPSNGSTSSYQKKVGVAPPLFSLPGRIYKRAIAVRIAYN